MLNQVTSDTFDRQTDSHRVNASWSMVKLQTPNYIIPIDHGLLVAALNISPRILLTDPAASCITLHRLDPGVVITYQDVTWILCPRKSLARRTLCRGNQSSD